MKIISLTEIQFKNYSRIHSKRNYLQSVEFANMQKNNGYDTLYIGMIDDNNNLTAAALILNKKIFNKYLYGYIPGGFLIDYNNFNLFNTFTKMLKEYLNSLNYVYISINPLVPITIMDKKKNILYNNSEILNTLEKLEYKKSKRETLNTSMLLEINKNIKNTYSQISRFIKRNIKDNKLMGIKVYQGTVDDYDEFYKLINKKKNIKETYFKDYFKYFNNDNNKFELYFASFDANLYLKNYHNLLNKEKRKNEYLSSKITDISIKNKQKYINKKINSDRLLEKYNNEIKKGINLSKKYSDVQIISTVGIIKTNNQIYFIVDSYNEELRDIRASYSIKWEIIKKYTKLGYKKFDLGYVPNDYNKFKGSYLAKSGFNAYTYKYPGQYNLIINNALYAIIYFFDKQKYQ